MKAFSTEEIKRIKEIYPSGTRVKLMSDMVGEKLKKDFVGTVSHVDDIGTVHVDWDCGSHLGLIVGIDKFRKLGDVEVEFIYGKG